MLQLYPALNLLDVWPVLLRLQLWEYPAPGNGLRVLVPVQEPRRLPAADAREGLLGNFCAAEHVPPANPLHCRALLPAYRTKGGCAEKEEEERGYSTEGGEDSGEDGGEDEWGEDSKGSLGNGSGASSASTSGDDRSPGGGRR